MESQPTSSRSPASTPPGEAALLAALRAGDEHAFETLVREHGGRLLRVARRFLGEEEARDAVQEAFLSAWKALPRFDGRARLSTWLHRIVVNAALMRLRSARRRSEEAIEPLLPRFLENGHRAGAGPAWPENPEQALGRAELRRRVRDAIDRLPPGYRSVLLLRDVEGLDGRESGAMLGLSPGAVKVRLHRARQALRESLDPHLREATP